MWAPNHHLTEPWRFIVIARSERLRLGDSMAEALRSTMKSDDPRVEEVLKREREKTLRAPVIIAVISSQTGGEKIVPQEEMVAAGSRSSKHFTCRTLSGSRFNSEDWSTFIFTTS